MLAATDPDVVLRNDLYDRDQARQWSRGPIVAGRATRRTRCDRIWARAAARASRTRRSWPASSTRTDDLPAAFARFAAFRRPRVRPLVRESKMIGQIVNLRPAFLSGLASRATVLVPEALMTRHLAAVAARSAFMLPSERDTASV